ncbi:MAG: threonine--tRNA ligase [Candidatus Aenigmarchaeota archaeon]|nr:threonine--tRNA ligase [Candidatus Aenigmarchaeota archaeon]
MKILCLHSNYIKVEPAKKAVKNADEIKKKLLESKEALVIFTAVEESDEKNPKEVLKGVVKEIVDVFDQVKAKEIVIYPYVHLTKNPSSPTFAKKVLDEIVDELSKEYAVKKAPFGWYKSFEISVKGHPLAELSREIKGEGEKIPEALQKEKKLKSEWMVLEPDGKENFLKVDDGNISGFDFSKYPRFEKLVKYEISKNRIVDKEPPHIKLMRKMEIADYENASDPGNFKFFPKGRLIKSLIEDWVTTNMVKSGAMEVETPIMYDYEHPALKNYLNRFPARQYTIKTPNKKVFLRFAACFGQFLILHNANISYRNLPMSLYELTKYSFRVEQRGELAGLRRLRTFTMPDCHAICKDIDQAKEEMLRRFDIAKKIQDGLNLTNDLELAIRVVKDFYEENKDFVKELVRKWGRPALIELWEEKFFYFVLKYEWNFVDALDKAACLTTDQIDVENSKRYDIKFTDKDNKEKYPLILHLSPSGAIERVMYALLEKAYMESQDKKNPTFPLWLSPTQVRFCPVNDSFIDYCEKLVDVLEKENIRADVDDRSESVQRKIRDAEVEWIPFIVVVGEKEKKSGKLAVRFRETGEVKEMSVEELANLIKNETKDYPFKPLPLPRLLSKRPKFVG